MGVSGKDAPLQVWQKGKQYGENPLYMVDEKKYNCLAQDKTLAVLYVRK